MDPGEKQLREIFEKTTIANIKAIISYNDQTQQLIRKLTGHVKDLDGVIRQFDEKLETLKKQLTALQAKVYQGGS